MCAVSTFLNRDNATFSIVFDTQTNTSKRLRYRLREYSLGSGNDVPARDPSSWTLYGSNDGKQWTTLETVSQFSFPTDRKMLFNFPIEVSVPYSQYRLDVHQSMAVTDSFQLSELVFWAAETYAEVGANAKISTFLNGNPHTSFGNNEREGNLQDQNTSTKMCATNVNINSQNNVFSLLWEFDSPEIVQMYSLATANDNALRDPVAWRIFGSENGDEWTELDYILDASELVPTDRFTEVDFMLENEMAYLFYRFDFLQTRGEDYAIQLSEMSLWSPKVPEPSTCLLLFLGIAGMVCYTRRMK